MLKNNWQLSRHYKFLLKPGFLIAFLALILLAYTLLPPVTLTFMVPKTEAKQWSLLIKDFEAHNRDIRIQLKEGPDNIGERQQLNAEALRRGDYDLAYMDIIWVPKLAELKLLKDLSDLISNEELAKFLASDVDGGRYKGGLYRIPLSSDVGMLYYRKDLLEKANVQPPETFDQLLQIAETLQKQRAVQWGYVWSGNQEGLVAMFVEVLQGYGGFWINPVTREVGLNKPESVHAVEFLRRTIDLGISSKDVIRYQEEKARDLFLGGKAVFLRDWALAKDSPIRGKIGIKPMVHAEGNSSGACKGGWGFGIATKTRHLDAAWKAINFFTSAATQRQFVLETGKLPARRSLFIDPRIVDKYSHFPKLLEVIENSVLRPPIPKYDLASLILQRYLSDALKGRLSPQEAMEAADKQTRQLMMSKG